MANPEHVEILERGVVEWNRWRNSVAIVPDLRQADFRDKVLSGVKFTGADLREADFCHTDLTDAKLDHADLLRADFYSAKLIRADLTGAKLVTAMFVQTDLTDANLDGSIVYGTSVWKVTLSPGTRQHNLIVTPEDEPTITVDNLEVAQFTYLLLNNKKIRNVIDTITSKLVLILGRFTPDRKLILDAIRAELRKRNYTPVLFDFEKPSHRDITETVSTLAHMARFVIADITDARSIPQELMAIVPNLPSVPVQPLLLTSQKEYGMFEHFRRFPWVLKPFLYKHQEALLAALPEKVIGPAERMAKKQTVG